MLPNTLKTSLIIRKCRPLLQSRFLNTRTLQNEEEAELVKPENESQQKLLKLAVIGLPNAGKSTFINGLMDRKVNILINLRIYTVIEI